MDKELEGFIDYLKELNLEPDEPETDEWIPVWFRDQHIGEVHSSSNPGQLFRCGDNTFLLRGYDSENKRYPASLMQADQHGIPRIRG